MCYGNADQSKIDTNTYGRDPRDRQRSYGAGDLQELGGRAGVKQTDTFSGKGNRSYILPPPIGVNPHPKW